MEEVNPQKNEFEFRQQYLQTFHGYLQPESHLNFDTIVITESLKPVEGGLLFEVKGDMFFIDFEHRVTYMDIIERHISKMFSEDYVVSARGFKIRGSSFHTDVLVKYKGCSNEASRNRSVQKWND